MNEGTEAILSMRSRAAGVWMIWILPVVFLLAGCGQTGQVAVAPAAPIQAIEVHTATAPAPTDTPSPTTTPTATATPTATPSPTASPTATPTPTPTALPAVFLGNPSSAVRSAPVPQAGAPCGLVDTLDFPLDPPDASNISFGGNDFGVYRGQYELYHAGEDWWGPNRRSSFGEPVFAIGHGEVTYADGNGWGRDQGVVIVRHVFSDGRSFLSFYGHLDPPSVTLLPGACVVRGQQVGEIGRPRTTPHLHFEIRTHLPYEPGGGYWNVDPRLGGWLPPSQTIWNERIRVAPGVAWTWPPDDQDLKVIDDLGDGTLLARAGNELIGIDLADGSVRWQQEAPVNLRAVAADATTGTIYLANHYGHVTALTVPPEAQRSGSPLLQVKWSVQREARGASELVVVPGVGVGLAARGQFTLFGEEGAVLWDVPISGSLMGSLQVDGWLALSTEGAEPGTWIVNLESGQHWSVPVGGELAQVGDYLLVHARDGIYRIELGRQAAELLLRLPAGSLDRGDIIALPDETLLVVHVDLYDRRLLWLEKDGTVLWQTSLRRTVTGNYRLLVQGDTAYLVVQPGWTAMGQTDVLEILLDQRAFLRLFVSGTRTPRSDSSTAFFVGTNQLVVNIGGGSLLLMDPIEARLQVQGGN